MSLLIIFNISFDLNTYVPFYSLDQFPNNQIFEERTVVKSLVFSKVITLDA